MRLLNGLFSRFSILKELFAFLRHNKLWWMIPVVAVLLLLSILIALTQGSALAPFIYTLF
jgi:hypothetical protein